MFAIPLSQSAPQAAQGVATIEAKSAFTMASAPMPEALNAKLGPAILVDNLMERSNNVAMTLQEPAQGMKMPSNSDLNYSVATIGAMTKELFSAFEDKSPDLDNPAVQTPAFRPTPFNMQPVL